MRRKEVQGSHSKFEAGSLTTFLEDEGQVRHLVDESAYDLPLPIVNHIYNQDLGAPALSVLHAERRPY